MKRLDTSRLEKGDIILTTSQEVVSKVIRKKTKSDISHAMLYVAHGSVMDSTGDGVQARNIQKMFYPDTCAIHVYRSIIRPDEAVLDRIVKYVRSETGAPYAKFEAARSAFKPPSKASDHQFCSRLVARAYEEAGLPLTANADYTTPADLQRSRELVEITAVVIEVSEEEQAYLEKMGDTTKGMREITSDLLARVRAIAPDIRVLNDIEPYLLANPAHDAIFAQAYKESGYLDFWRVELERHSYRYDSMRMVQFYHSLEDKSELLDYCRQTLQDDASGDFGHWKTNLDAYSALVNVRPLQTFQLNRDLYFKLVFNHDQRVKIAGMILKLFGTTSAGT